MSPRRNPVPGYERYTTDGINVFRGNNKQRVRGGVYHLVRVGCVMFDEVDVDYALGVALEAEEVDEVEEVEFSE